MSAEFVGEVTIRSSKPDAVVVASAARLLKSAAGGSPLNPHEEALLGPVTIRLSGDGREIMVGGSPAEAPTTRIHLDGQEGDITVRDFNGSDVLRFDSRFAVLDIGGLGNEGDIRVRDGGDATTIHLDGSSGDIILSNGDAAEDFDVCSLEAAVPGTVMVLEPDGRLHPCSSRYDSRVVGVVAGAGAYRPALILDRQEATETERAPISILGKVSVRADATEVPIRVGDLLATSSSAGRAMAVDPSTAPIGAVLGKALTPLDDGVGLVDMLISLH